MTASDIRRQFLDFFASKGHLIVPSAPIVVKNDPTLLFINSGMAPFKDAFLGNKPAPAPRVADTQKCLRVSGKHNDLEEVGVDTYHHTMFEMLGNWSFGDYFKKEAIDWSWELLTEVYKIPKDQLYVTVFGGDEAEGLPRDEEALSFWRAHVAEDRILFGNKKDNFWEMGDTGPCGPCTEIHVDTRTPEEREDGRGASLVNADHPQVIEIWNNVFMQFNRVKDGSLHPLPAQHVDTGMGFERLVRVLQGKQSNYDTDVFSGTIAAIARITGKDYTATDSKQDIAFRVLADHIRAIAFTIADGQLPSNTGAGYVIRRILRRAVRYYYSYLDYKQPLLFQLIPIIAKQFENVFPELHKQEDFVVKVVKEEEDAFLRTLEKGLKRLDELIASSTANIIDGTTAFELFDTYGFPIDLTRLIASEKGYTVDEAGFEKGLQEQKARSRAATALDTEDWVVLKEGASKFIGYDSLETKTEVLRYRKVKAKGKESYQIVLAETPFYAESGGQVGDKGKLAIGNLQFAIIDTKKENDLIIHFAESIPEDLNGEVIASVDIERRLNTEVHHSATHLMHAALRSVLGTHVAQKGSLVNQEHLRFDFSHFAKMTDEELAAVERLVNEKIRENVPVIIKSMSKDEAIAMGAMALFGEKYADVVRVVIMDPNYSIELCGGTHVGNTGELGFFKIKSEGAVAAGVRRIEAVSGAAAEEYIQSELAQLRAAREAFKNPKDLGKSIESLQEETATLRKKLEAMEDRQLAAMAEELSQKGESQNGFRFVGAHVDVSSMDALRKLSGDVLRKLADGVAVLTSIINEKASVAIAVSEAVQQKGVDAGKLIKEQVAPLIKGGGGGQKGLATAGGQDAGRLPEVIAQVKAALQALSSAE
jgi:alanyl-tRNA synthetase